MRPMGHEASRTRTGVPLAQPGAVFGPVLAQFWGPPSWGCHGAELGGSPELETGILGGHQSERLALEFQAGAKTGANTVKNLLL